MPLALIPAAIGVAGSIIGGATGVGKDNTPRSNFGQSEQYNKNAFNYGGKASGADEAANFYSQAGLNAQNRGAAQADYTLADSYARAGLDARTAQAQSANLMMARAQGLVPSIAQQQAALDMQRAAASQSSLAAGARGAAGLALAGQQAASNTANLQGAISQQAQVNAATERMQAEQAAFGAYGGLRGGDLASQQQFGQQAQYNANLQMQQRNLNDNYGISLLQQSDAIRRAQLDAQIQQQSILSSSYDGQQRLEATRRAQNAGVDRKYLEAGVSSLQDGFKTPGMPGAGGGKK